MAIDVSSTNPVLNSFDAQQAAIDDARARYLKASKAAADYLELSPTAIRGRLELGQALSAIAQAQGKDVERLRSAMLDSLSVRPPAPVNASTLVDRLLYGWTEQDGEERGALSPRPRGSPAEAEAQETAADGGQDPLKEFLQRQRASSERMESLSEEEQVQEATALQLSLQLALRRTLQTADHGHIDWSRIVDQRELRDLRELLERREVQSQEEDGLLRHVSTLV